MLSRTSQRVLLLAMGLLPLAFPSSTHAAEEPSQAAEKKATSPSNFDLTAVRGNPVVARIDGKKEITLKEVLQAMQAIPAELRRLPVDKLFAAARDQLIDLSILEQAAEQERDNILKDPEVKEAIEKATHQIIIEFYLRKITKNAVSEDKIKERYTKLVGKFPKDEKEARIRHILVKTEDEAKAIIKSLKEGADFLTLAREKSIDKESASKGGDLGYMSILQKDALVPAFSEAVFKKDKQGNYGLATGSFTETPIKTDFGWHVIKIDDRRPLKAPKFQEIRSFLVNQLNQEAVEGHLKSLGGKQKIERLDPISGKPVKSLAEELQDMASQKTEDATKEQPK